MNDFLSLIKREFKQFRSNKVALAVFFGAPLLYSFLFGFVYQEAKVVELPVTVLDLDHSSLSGKVVEALEDNQSVKVAQVRYDEFAARKDFESQQSLAVIRIPEGFTENIYQKKQPLIDVELNTSNLLTANTLARGVQQTLGTLNAGIEIEGLMKKGMPREIALNQWQAFGINFTRFFNPAGNYLQFMMPGLLATLLQQVFLLVLALSFSKEDDDNSYGELLSLSQSPLKLLIGKSLPYWLSGTLLWFFVTGVIMPFFRIPPVASLEAMALLSILFTLSVTLLGVVVSILVPNQLRATEILMVIATPAFVLSGFTWPVDQMPEFLQIIAEMIPLTHFATAFRSLIFTGGGLEQIQPQILALSIYSVVMFIMAWLALSWKVKKMSPKQLAD